MAEYTIKELFFGEKYNIMGNVAKDILLNGTDGDELHLATELKIIKHALLVAKKMHDEGDCVSDDGITIVF